MSLLSRRLEPVYLLAALLALCAHGAVFALSWERPPSVKFHVQGAPGVEIRLASIAAAPEPAPAVSPQTERAAPPEPQARPTPPVPKAIVQERPDAQKLRQAALSEQSASAAYAPERTTAQSATSPEPLGSLDNKQPRYPELARKRGQQGQVTLLVRVNAEGGVQNAIIQTGSGYSLLDKSALDAVKKWRFRPARLNGLPVAGSALVTVEFRLE